MKVKQPAYTVKKIVTHDKPDYLVIVKNRIPTRITRRMNMFYVHGVYRKTLRDAIIYVIYGE